MMLLDDASEMHLHDLEIHIKGCADPHIPVYEYLRAFHLDRLAEFSEILNQNKYMIQLCKYTFFHSNMYLLQH